MLIDDADLFAERLASELCVIARSALADLDIVNLCGLHATMKELAEHIDGVIWDRIRADVREHFRRRRS